MATLKSIAYKPKDSANRHTSGIYVRHFLTETVLVEDLGIEDDQKSGNQARSLNVTDEITLAELSAEGLPAGPGQLGENLIIGGLNMRQLSAGMCLRIGAEAVIELRKLRTGCNQLHSLDTRMPDHVVGRIGWMCRVVRTGYVTLGDVVEVVTESVTRA